MKSKYIFVGPDPINISNNHPGGQLSAAQGLIQYADEYNKKIFIIDTLQSSFPIPPLRIRVKKALFRIKKTIRILSGQKIKGVIIFSAEGASLIEKIIISFICNLFSTPSIVFIRSGFFIDQFNDSRIWRMIYYFLLKIPPYLGSQGNQWNQLFQKIKINKKKVILVRNWILPDKILSKDLNKKQKKGSLTFLFTGWLVKAKGVLDLIEAFNHSDILRNCHLILAGDGNLMNQIKKDIKKNEIHNISLLGWCKPEKIDKLLLSSDVFVLPSYSEGFPNSLVEALAKGIPVITTPVGGISDSVINYHNGFLIKVGDKEMLRNRMEWFALNKIKLNEFSLNSLAIAKNNHDYYSNCKNLFNIFR